MDGIASVLFVVTIPTAAEEERLKREFLAKEYNLIKSDQNDDDTPTTDYNVYSEKTTTTTNELNPNITQTIFGTLNGSNKNNIYKNGNQVKNHNVETTIGADSRSGSIPYDSFPKHRKSTLRNNIVEELSDNIANQQLPATSGIKESDIITADDLQPTRKSLENIKEFLSSTKRKELKKQTQCIDMETSHEIYMEAVLKQILCTFHIQGATWNKDAEGLMYQIFYTVELNETYEKILLSLNEWGIGYRQGSAVSVMSCITSKTFSQTVENDLENNFNIKNNLTQKQSAWERFMNSVRSRLNVANIIRDVRQDAAINFDFVILLVSAAILASFGLVEDSTIFLASSMLISPLMGPIIAAIFGTVIKDHSLCKLGIKNELIGILVATFVGFLFGMIVCTTNDRYSTGDGLTDEMIARCKLHSLIVGIFTAVPSGAAAAIGILGGNIGSLVGVAISASLLPPAVNSGLLWALALIYKTFEKDETRYINVVKNPMYSNNQASELAILGSISMCLTISNIICIYIMGILVLKIKEIAPVISRNNREFWKHDIKIARNLNRNGFDTDAAIIDEFQNLPKEDQRALGVSCDFLRNIHTDDNIYQNTWSPIGGRHPFENTHETIKMNYSTVHRIERLYSTITQQHAMMDRRHKYLAQVPRGRTTDIGSSYEILTENLPRCCTTPTKYPCATINTVASEPNCNIHERKPRKFTVTPAEEDPLHSVNMYSDDADV